MGNNGHIAIIGFGLEGRALFFYLRKNGERDITILDQNPELKIPAGAKAILGKKYLGSLQEFDLIFKSQGVPHHLLQIRKVKSRVSSLTDLFFDKAKGEIIGITGSAGKTTTTTLICNILKEGKKKFFLGGNIGKNPLEFLSKLDERSLTVMELSSFQLQDIKKSPHIAVVLDVYEEHLDKHKNLRDYLNAKANIARFQRPSDYIIFSKDSPYARRIAAVSRAKKFSFSLHNTKEDFYFCSTPSVGQRGAICDAHGKVLDLAGIKITGMHNIKNVMAAMLVAKIIGVPAGVVRQAIRRFRGLPHRLEFVRDIRGVRFYNDASAVNIQAAIASMNSFSEDKVVLAGGQNKNLPLGTLARRLAKSDIRFAVLFGKMRRELATLLRKGGMKNFAVKATMLGAVLEAVKRAKRGDIVLLSPGSASFDEFHDYQERGNRFKEFVKSLAP